VKWEKGQKREIECSCEVRNSKKIATNRKKFNRVNFFLEHFGVEFWSGLKKEFEEFLEELGNDEEL
jgi:hypothetical protein